MKPMAAMTASKPKYVDMTNGGASCDLPCLSRRAVSLEASIDGPFVPMERSVYFGREFLGRYYRVGVRRYVAVDQHDFWLGDYKKRSRAYHAIKNRFEHVKALHDTPAERGTQGGRQNFNRWAPRTGSKQKQLHARTSN
jgi:hypothetical protein